MPAYATEGSNTDKILQQDLFEAQTKLSSSPREHKELTKSVTYFLAKDMQPAYTVEKSGFQQTLSKFNPCYYVSSSRITSVEWRSLHYTLKLKASYNRR